VTAVTLPLSLTDLTGKQRYSPRSDCCANHQGKTESRSSTSSASGAIGSSASPDLRPRPQPRPREKVSASPDPRPWPQPQPREESHPRPTSVSALGEVSASPDLRPRPREKVSASPDLGLGPTTLQGYIITLPLASCLRLQRNKTGVLSKVTPVTGNDGSPRVPMTSVALKPPTKASKRQQDPCRTASYASTDSRHFSDGHVSSCTGLKALLCQPR
jgi:hypothetical protein